MRVSLFQLSNSFTLSSLFVYAYDEQQLSNSEQDPYTLNKLNTSNSRGGWGGIINIMLYGFSNRNAPPQVQHLYYNVVLTSLSNMIFNLKIELGNKNIKQSNCLHITLCDSTTLQKHVIVGCRSVTSGEPVPDCVSVYVPDMVWPGDTYASESPFTEPV